MANKIIGIDLDSTLNCLTKGWLELYNTDYNDTLTINDIRSWDWSSIVKPECGKKIYEYLSKPRFFYDLEVQEDAQEVTRWLIEEKKCEIQIVTASSPVEFLDKIYWSSKYFPHIPERNIMMCYNKGRFNGDFLIDDGGHNAEAFYKSNPNSIPLLYDSPCPWNHYLGDAFKRMHSWKGIQRYFEEVL